MINWLKNFFIPFAGEETAFRRQNPQFAARMEAFLPKSAANTPVNLQSHYVASGRGKVYGAMNGGNDPQGLIRTKNLIQEWYRQAIHDVPNVAAIPIEGLVPYDNKEPPESVSVISGFSRPRSVPKGLETHVGHYGRSQLWVEAEEVKAMLSASQGNDAPFWMPKTLVMRMIVGNLVDNVRANSNWWRANEVKKALFSVRAVGGNETSRKFVFAGPFEMRRTEWDCGYVGNIQGEFEVNIPAAKIARFRALSSGEAWGNMTWHGAPGSPPGPHFPLDIAFAETTDPVARKMLPFHDLFNPDNYKPPLVIP